MPEKNRCNTIDEMTLYDSREMNYGSKFRNQSSSVNQGEDEVADELSDNATRFPKDGFLQLCEQGDNICQINDIMGYARGNDTRFKL